MSEWFEKAFGEYYLKLYAHRDSAEAGKVADLVLRNTGLKTGALVLDAPCGAGRHMKVFQERGLKTFGFDLSQDLLREAAKIGVHPGTIVRADLRAMPFKPGRFDLLVNLFSSFGYFDSDETNRAVLKNLTALVRPEGWIVIDFMNSEHVRQNLMRESHRVTSEGLQVQDFRSIEGDPPRINKKTIVTFPDGREMDFKESVRLYTHDELKTLLTNAGVTVESEFGDYSEGAITPESPRVILIGRRQ